MSNIYFTKKNVYGKELVYPACGVAHAFTLLTGSKTFSVYQLQVIAGLGYTINVDNNLSPFNASQAA